MYFLGVGRLNLLLLTCFFSRLNNSGQHHENALGSTCYSLWTSFASTPSDRYLPCYVRGELWKTFLWCSHHKVSFPWKGRTCANQHFWGGSESRHKESRNGSSSRLWRWVDMGDKESLWEPTTRSYFQAWESKPTPQEPRLVTGTCLLSSAMYLLLCFSKDHLRTLDIFWKSKRSFERS